VTHDHTPVDESATHASPVVVHEPADGLVPCSAYDNCTNAPIGADPVNVSVVAEVRLSVDDEPLSAATARSGVETDGNS
jgi:hypothetical protein